MTTQTQVRSTEEALSVEDTLKLALEALESSNKLINGTGTKFGLEGAMDGYYSGCFDVEGNNKLLNKAITAIKEVLAQPEQQSNEHLEPVAWRFTGIAGLKRYMTQKQYGAQTLETKKWYEPYKCVNCTTPPNRKPLTDEQIYLITGVENRDEMMHRMARNIARAIEAAHGIKE